MRNRKKAQRKREKTRERQGTESRAGQRAAGRFWWTRDGRYVTNSGSSSRSSTEDRRTSRTATDGPRQVRKSAEERIKELVECDQPLEYVQLTRLFRKAILGRDKVEDVEAAVATKRYRRFSILYHPDKHRDRSERFSQCFQALSSAHEDLLNDIQLSAW